MPNYAYEAADKQGRKVRDTLEATDEAAVRQRLKEMQLMPISISSVSSSTQGISLERITKKDLLIFTQELGNLMESGIPIDKAIYILSTHSQKTAMRKVLQEVYKDIQRGQSLSAAMGRHKMFPPLYVNMVRAGEAGGILDSVIKRLAVFIESTVAFQEELISALIYPIILTLVGGVSVVFIVLYVIPRFAVMFEDMGQALPLPTLILMDISGFVAAWWWLLLAAAVGIAMLIRYYGATDEGRALFDAIKLKTPIVSGLLKRAMIARFTRTLGTLLQSGVPILEAITISRNVVGNTVIAERMKALEEGVRKGRGVTAPLKDTGVMPPLVIQMIAVGEEAGRLESTFIQVAERFEAESRNMIKRAMSMLAPMLILLMSLIVGFIVISMLLAVFSLNEIPM